MNNLRKILKILGVLVLVLGLFAFSNYRAAKRKTNGVAISFLGTDKLFVSNEAVNKLLIQNYGPLEMVGKDKVDLGNLEKTILSHDMVKNVELYCAVNGQVRADIVQKTPIGRVTGMAKYYLDDEGKSMPLSPYYTARVPLITGKMAAESLENVYVLLNFINQDDFLKKNIIGIHVEASNAYQLKFRLENFMVHLGTVGNLDKKFENFKAFYVKAKKDKVLDTYKMISLEFDNQVVCTKI